MKLRLRIRLSHFGLLLVLLAALPAQLAAQQPAPARRVLMWKVVSPTSTMYLLGSIHVGDKSFYPLPQEIEAAFAASKALVVEINIKSMDQAQAVALVQKYGLYGGDDSLSKHVSKDTSTALDEFCSKHGMPRAAFEHLKPWVVAITVIAAALQEGGSDPKLGIDMHFLDQVKPSQRLEELETADFQMSLFADETEQEQQEMLALSLKQAGKEKEMLDKIQDAYFSADAEQILKLSREEQSGPQSLMKKMIDDRNVTMAAKLENYLKKNEQMFVVVGVLHLVGEKGIVRLLQDKGFKVETMTVLVK
jgi:uncharacterized protein YbaP (TraB family)